MKPRFRSLASRVAPFAGVVVFSLAGPATAADQTWTGGGIDALWTNTTNWSGTAVPGSGDLAIFDTASTANLATTLGANASVLGIRVIAPSGAVSVAAGNTLTLGASGVDLSAANQNLTLSGPVTLGSNQIWNVGSGRTLTSNGGIGGTGSLTKNGAGQLTLGNVANGFSGGATLNAGVVLVGSGTSASPANLGAAGSTIALNGGTLSNGTGGSNGSIGFNNVFNVIAESTINLGNRFAMSGTVTGSATLNVNAGTTVARDDLNNNWTGFTGIVKFGGSGGIRLMRNGGSFNTGSFANCTVDMGGSASIRPRNGSTGETYSIGKLTGTSTTAELGAPDFGGTSTYSIGGLNQNSSFAGGIRGNSILTKTGSGVLTLTNTTLLDYTGVTNINEGVLKCNGTKTGAGATNVNNNGTLSGTGTLAGTTTVANGGTLAPGDGGVGNINFANLGLATGSTVAVEFGAGNDTATIQTGGTLTLASGANVDVNGFNTNGTYTIFNVTGVTVSGTPSAALAVVNGDPAKVYTFSSDMAAVYLNISETDPSNFWNVDGAGSWGTASNWTKNLVPNAPGANAKVGPGVGGAGGSFTPTSFAIDLDGVRTVGEIVLNDDFGTAFTIAPGTSGSLLMDNSAAISNIVVSKGSHSITAPVAVDADDVSFDVGDLHNLEVAGVISSSASGGGVVKAGPGTLRLTGINTYDGGTLISAGALAINNTSSLGNVAVPATFTGGTLRILNDLTDSRSYQVSGSSNAVIDTNAFNYTYGGVVSPTGGGTGGLTKTGAGTLLLSTAQTYTGATTVNAGVLEVATGGSINGAALNFGTTAGTLFHVNGGSFNGTTSTVSAGITGFRLSSGSATFTGALNAQDNATGALALINVLGGNLSAASLSVGRSSNAVTVEPAAGATNSGFLVDGAGSIVNITGNLSVAGSNSTANARMDAGSVTVGGSATIGLNNAGRWSVLDVNGCTFTLNNTATGVQLGNGQTGNAIFIVQDGGVANVGKFTFNAAGAVAYSEIVRVNGGTLYVGAGGMVRTGTNALCVSSLKLQGGTLAASADWTSAIDTELSGTPVIQAADSLAAAFNITLSGVLSGTDGFTKTGAGTLTLSGANTYAGTTNITAGKLVIAGDQSGATGDVTTTTGTTLGGNGNIGGNVTIASGATHQLAVAATAGAQVTRVITGTLTLSGGDIIDLTSAATPAAGSYTLATATGGITGTLATSTINYNGITGTLDIVGGNSLVLTVTGSGYASWAATKGLTAGVNDGPTDDPDFDGVDNALEFVLGGEPLASDPSILPDLAVTSTDFVFTFNRSDESEAEIALTFQHGTNLSSWTDVAIGAAGAGVVGVVENDAAPDTVTVTIPKGANTSLFGRLQAVK